MKTHNFNSSKLIFEKSSFILNQSKRLRVPKMKCRPSKSFACRLLCVSKIKGNYFNFTVLSFTGHCHLYDETFCCRLWKSRWYSQRKTLWPFPSPIFHSILTGNFDKKQYISMKNFDFSESVFSTPEFTGSIPPCAGQRRYSIYQHINWQRSLGLPLVWAPV